MRIDGEFIPFLFLYYPLSIYNVYIEICMYAFIHQKNVNVFIEATNRSTSYEKRGTIQSDMHCMTPFDTVELFGFLPSAT